MSGKIIVTLFLSICRFIYCEEVHLTHDNVMAVFYASTVYFLPLLTKKCKEFLIKCMSKDNVCTILEHSVLYNEDELILESLKFIAPIAESLLNDEDFLNFSQPTLKTLMQYNFYCENEKTVYESCLRWAIAQCKRNQMEANDENMRTVLGDAIYKIRFSRMDQADFEQIAQTSAILTDSEKLDILLAKTREETSGESNGNSQFSHQPRSRKITFLRYRSVKKEYRRWCYDEPKEDAITFKSDKALLLIGLSIYGGYRTVEHLVEVVIKNSAIELLSEVKGIRVVSDGSTTPKVIHLSQPVSIHPGQIYHVVVTIRGPLSYFGQDGQQNLSHGDIHLEFYDSKMSKNKTKVGIGQIPELIALDMGGEHGAMIN